MHNPPRIPIPRLLSVLDATFLEDDATEDQMRAFLARIKGKGMAAVCVQEPWIALAKTLLNGDPIAIAAVANFPDGYGGPDDVGEEVDRLVALGATEIDVVVPIDTLDHDEGLAIRWTIEAAREAAPKAVIKAILETGALETQKRIARAAGAAISGGADFLKTSTGRHAVGATTEAVDTLLHVMLAYPGKVGLKISGGIATAENATAYWNQAERAMGAQWCHRKRFRIGASRLLDALF